MIPTFTDGRAAVELDSGYVLSIITPERNEHIRAAAQWSPSYLMGGWTLMDAECDGETYEVSFRLWNSTRSRTDSANDIIPRGWEDYVKDDDGDMIFAYVPRDLVHALLDEHHAKEVDA
jgi:hypothetical protein